MRMRAALVPPAPVLNELAELVRAVGGDTDELEPVPVGSLHLLITSFGNVAQGDAVALETALRGVGARWEPMQLRFAGAAALEWPGDDSVWATTEGDVERLADLARAVPASVQRLGFLLDRRTFRTWVRVGRITATTTEGYLERLVGRLEDYRGPAWLAEDLILLRERYAAVGPGAHYEPYRRFPLSGEATAGLTGG